MSSKAKRRKIIPKDCCICGKHIATAQFNPRPLPGDACCEYCYRATVLPVAVLAVGSGNYMELMRQCKTPKKGK